MIVATRADFVTGFAQAWKGMGFTGPLLIPEECEGLPDDLEGVERAPFAEQLPRADMFIFEFGLPTQTASEPVRAGRAMAPLDKKRLKVVERLFKRAAASEAETRPRPAVACRAASSASTSSTTSSGRPSPTMSVPTSTRSAARSWPACRARINSMKGKVLRFRGRHAL